MPTFAELEAAGARIGEIRIVAGDIFDLSDPRENNCFFRLANKLHINTRPNVIRQALLFESGQPVSVQKIEETERLLRGYRLPLRRRPSGRSRYMTASPTSRSVRATPGRSTSAPARAARAAQTRAASPSRRRTCSAPASRSGCPTPRMSTATGTTLQYRRPQPVRHARPRVSYSYAENSDGSASRSRCSVRSTRSMRAGRPASAPPKASAPRRCTTRATSSPSTASAARTWRRSAAGRRA